MKTYALLGAVALITSSASALFTGWTAEKSIVGDRTVYKIYANFSNTGTAGSEGSNARVLNVFDFAKADSTPENGQIAAGSSGVMSAVHNDNYIGDIDTDGDGTNDYFGSLGTWVGDAAAMSSTQSLTDSFVTMQGIGNGWGTALDPSFVFPYGTGADGIHPPNNDAGWYDSTPGTPNLVGTTMKVRLIQITRLTANDNTIYQANMTLGYSAFGTTTALFGYGSFTIGTPAPGALALLGLAGAFGRRRRS